MYTYTDTHFLVIFNFLPFIPGIIPEIIHLELYILYFIQLIFYT